MTSKPRAADTRKRVLDAALALYAQEGHAGYNVHAIAARSGVSLGSLYHHFGSMDGLSAALYARSMAGLLDEVVASVESARSLRRGVTAVVQAYLGFARAQRSAMTFIHVSAYAAFLPAHAALIAQSKGPRIERIQRFFMRHVADGRIVAMPVALLEVLIIGPVAELTRRWLSDPDTFDLEQAGRVLPARILAAISAPSV